MRVFVLVSTVGVFVAGVSFKTVPGDGYILFSVDHTLVAFDALTGVLKWSYTSGFAPTHMVGSPATIGDGEHMCLGVLCAPSLPPPPPSLCPTTHASSDIQPSRCFCLSGVVFTPVILVMGVWCWPWRPGVRRYRILGQLRWLRVVLGPHWR